MKCYYHVNRDAVGQCVQCGRFACYLCLVDVGGMLLCPACEADAQQQIALEQARLLSSAKRAVTASTLLAYVLLVCLVLLALVASMNPDVNALGKIGVLLSTVLSAYTFWSGCWGWGPVTRACKTGLSQTGCFLLATPMTWLFLLLMGGMVLFIAAECYGACGVAIARHRKAALIASGHLPPQPY